MTTPVWIEAAINGPWGVERQPGIPIAIADIVADGIAAVEAGAAIVHLHVYDVETGRQRDDWELYAQAIEGIRAKVDAIVYPTIPIVGSSYAGDTIGSGRYTHLEELAKRGLVEWGVLDPGSCNWTTFAGIPQAEGGFIYQNPEEHIREGMAVAQTHRVHPSFAIYEPGFTRLGAALAKAYPGMPTPIYRLMFSDHFAWGFPPREYALDAHLKLLAEDAPGAPVMIAGLGVDLTALIGPAVARGVHVRAGLEDAPFGCGRTNAGLVTETVRLVEAAGGRVASVAEVRADLAGGFESARGAALSGQRALPSIGTGMLKLDHLSIIAPSLAEGVAHVRTCLDLDVPFGQRHAFMGTYNHLIQLGDMTYLEIIALDQEAARPDRARWFGLDDQKQVRRDWDNGRRLRGWVARTDEIDRVLDGREAIFGRKVTLPTFDFSIPEDGSLPLNGAVPSVIDRRGKPRVMTTIADLGARLRTLTLEHPDADALISLLQEVGIDRPPVILRGAELRYRAQIDLPNGLRELS